MKRPLLLIGFFLFCSLSFVTWTMAFTSSLGWGGGGLLFVGMLMGIVGLFCGGLALGDQLQLKIKLWPALFLSSLYAVIAGIVWSLPYSEEKAPLMFPALFLLTTFGWLGVQLLTHE